MTTVYLIRHAEAEGNLYRRIHGHYDSLVTVRGHQQIKALAKRFKEIPIDAVYTSDLVRTMMTSEAIKAAKGQQVTVNSQLREVDMGIWEDKTWGEVEYFQPQVLDDFNDDPVHWNVKGCEMFYNLQARIANAVLSIANKHDGETIAIVSHGSAIRSLVCKVLNIVPEETKHIKHSDNTAVACLHVSGNEMHLEYYGDNSHLSDDISTFAHQKWWRENTTYDSTNLRFLQFNLTDDAKRYIAYRSDAWTAVGCENAERHLDRWLKAAKSNAALHERAVTLALIGDTPAGMLELDIHTGAADKTGLIEFFYMTSDYRRTGIAVQLFGQAVSVFRSLGMENIRMTVSDRNETALRFCEKYGFVNTGNVQTADERQLLMEMNIKLPTL